MPGKIINIHRPPSTLTAIQDGVDSIQAAPLVSHPPAPVYPFHQDDEDQRSRGPVQVEVSGRSGDFVTGRRDVTECEVTRNLAIKLVSLNESKLGASGHWRSQRRSRAEPEHLHGPLAPPGAAR